jgi:hypothetical protein
MGSFLLGVSDSWSQERSLENSAQYSFLLPLPSLKEFIGSRAIDKDSSFCFETGIGYRISYANDEKIVGANLRIAGEYSDSHSHFLRIDGSTAVDLADDKDEIDFDRNALWFEGRLSGGAYPLDLFKDDSKVLRLGLRGCLEGQENSPTSIEHSVLMNFGPSLLFQTKKQSLNLDIGLSNNHLELDDDVPSTLGFDRADLTVSSVGISCGVGVNHFFNNGIGVGLKARHLENVSGDYSETNIGTQIEVPLSLLLGDSCKLWVRASVEQRFFDLGEKSSALPFDDEIFGGIEFIWRPGKRSPLSWGY